MIEQKYIEFSNSAQSHNLFRKDRLLVNFYILGKLIVIKSWEENQFQAPVS